MAGVRDARTFDGGKPLAVPSQDLVLGCYYLFSVDRTFPAEMVGPARLGSTAGPAPGSTARGEDLDILREKARGDT
jgi:DNA-directed RNA polymerase beta' subunit